MTHFLCLFIVEGLGLGFFLFVMKPCCVGRPVGWWVFHLLRNQVVTKPSRGFRKSICQ